MRRTLSEALEMCVGAVCFCLAIALLIRQLDLLGGMSSAVFGITQGRFAAEGTELIYGDSD